MKISFRDSVTSFQFDPKQEWRVRDLVFVKAMIAWGLPGSTDDYTLTDEKGAFINLEHTVRSSGITNDSNLVLCRRNAPASEVS